MPVLILQTAAGFAKFHKLATQVTDARWLAGARPALGAVRNMALVTKAISKNITVC